MNSEIEDKITEKMKMLSRMNSEVGFKLVFNPFDFKMEDTFTTVLFLNGKEEWIYPRFNVSYDKPKLFKV